MTQFTHWRLRISDPHGRAWRRGPRQQFNRLRPRRLRVNRNGWRSDRSVAPPCGRSSLIEFTSSGVAISYTGTAVGQQAGMEAASPSGGTLGRKSLRPQKPWNIIEPITVPLSRNLLILLCPQSPLGSAIQSRFISVAPLPRRRCLLCAQRLATRPGLAIVGILSSGNRWKYGCASSSTRAKDGRAIRRSR